MPLQALPASVAAYAAAVNGQDINGVVNAFDPDALIVDVDRRVEGHSAIRHWADTEVIGGRLEVLEEHPTDRGTDLLIRFTPPGATSGFKAWYRFTATNESITRADLSYA